MKRLFKYISLVGAKLVGRRHNRDVDPPGLKELKNAFVSRSDSAITCRPDFDPISESLIAVSDSFASAYSIDDYLNSTTGIYGTDSLISFSKLAPISWDGSSSSIACSSYSTGTVSVALDGTSVTGSGTTWQQDVWSGCIIEFDDSGVYYKVSSVTSDTSLTISEGAESVYTDVSYVIYRTHQPDHANYKLNLQPFTTGMIYSSPTVTMPVTAGKICGPFYASVAESSVERVWVNFTDDDTYISGTGDGQDPYSDVAAGGGNFMCVLESNVINGTAIVIQSSSPASDWSEVTSYPSNFEFSGRCCYSGGKFYFSGNDTANSDAACVVITADLGSTWIKRTSSGSGYAATTGGAICATSTGRVLVGATGQGGDSQKDIAYSDDDFATWTATSSSIPFGASRFIAAGLSSGGDEYLVASSGTTSGSLIYSTDNGETWSSYTYGVAGGTICGVYSPQQDFWLFGSTGGDTTKITGANPADWSSPDINYNTPVSNTIYNMVYAGDKFVLSLSNGLIYETGDAVSYELVHTAANGGGGGLAFDGVSQIVAVMSYNSYEEKAYFSVSNQVQSVTSWSSASFEPLSDTYRALTHSVLDGYVVLFGVREYQSTNNSWEYHPRRIRWTTPLTYNDFSSSGSGTADLVGSGALLDSRTVNGRIVVFESSAIGALSPRGYSTDPWEYDRIKENIRNISNPVVVDDMCYFVDDAGLLRATNGISVESPPFSFDLSEYDDFNADSPVWLSYAPEFESLAVYNPSATNHYVYMIEVDSGSVSRFELEDVANGGSALIPKSIVCVENSDDRRMMVTYNPIAADTDELVCAELSTGDTITGKDEWTSEAGDDTYNSTVFETGEIYLVPEGGKTSIKHIIVRTYTDGSTQSTNPVVGVQLKSLEDTAWHCAGDTNGTITVDTDSCDGTNTAWSNTLDATNDPVYATPCLATQARIYVGSSVQTAGTDYTITGTKEITFGASPGDTVYAYWENQPEVKVEAGDLISSTEGHHLISSVTNQKLMVLGHYLSSGSDATAVHIPAERMPNGDGEVKIGLNKLVEGVRIRVIVMHDSGGDATVTKVTGLVVGHVPCGEKKIEK